MKKRYGMIALLAAGALLIGAAVWTTREKKADVSNVDRVIGYSALYGDKTIGKALDAAEQKITVLMKNRETGKIEEQDFSPSAE